jgi:beta-phosphoglucomutase-like phosphatase (HAD superfamily)
MGALSRRLVGVSSMRITHTLVVEDADAATAAAAAAVVVVVAVPVLNNVPATTGSLGHSHSKRAALALV